MIKKAITVLFLALMLTVQAKAADKGAVELKSIAEVEVTATNEKGEKEVKRVEASKAKVVPGDTVIFTNTYANTGKDPATGVVITNPVPEHMIYTEGSAEGKGAKIEFSVDNGKTFASAAKLKIKRADGKEKTATASDYTHIRWTLEKPVEKGAKGSVSFRAKVK